MLTYKNLQFQIKSIDVESHSILGIFSTSAVDRHGEIVDQTSWKLDEYMKSPVILFGHDHSQPAIGKMTELTATGHSLEGKIVFAVTENPFAKIIWELYKGGFMSAFSVGFSSEKQEMNGDGVTVLKDNVLFEVSAVNVPANADALMKAKASGIDVSMLVKEGRVLSKKNRSIIENAYTALGEVLDVSDKTEEEESSANKSTQQGRGVSRTWDRNKTAMSILNKAIRALYREQR